MHFTDITFRDFGADIFQDTRISDIDQNLVVIGGPQRAGKTTFLEAMRRVGYGIEPNPALPPPVEAYNLQATLEHDGYEYAVRVRGHSDPTVISTGRGPDLTVADLYGGVSKKQYQQLFTITLDELERIPDTIDDAEDLSEVLLGAAYGDVALIPAMEETFAERAYEIGRSYGKPTKQSELSGPAQKIKDGIEARDAANKQVAEWGAAREELQDVEGGIRELQMEQSRLEAKQERVAVLSDEFEALREYQALVESVSTADIDAAESLPEDAVGRASRLASTYDDAIAEYEAARDDVAGRTLDGEPDAYKQALLDHRPAIERFDRQVAKWETKVEELTQETEDVASRRADIERRIRGLRDDWTGRFDEVLAVRTDTVSAGDVSAAVEDYRSAVSDLETAKKERDRAATRLSEYENQLANESSPDDGDGARRSLLVKTVAVGGLSLAVGVGGSVAGYPLIGGLVGFVLLLVGLYAATSSSADTGSGMNTARELKSQIQTVKADVGAAEDAIEDAKSRRDEASAELSDIADTVGLPEDVQPESLEAFYEEVTACTVEIQAVKDTEAVLSDERQALVAELSEAAETMANVRPHQWEAGEPLATAGHLFDAIQAAADDLERAQRLHAAQRDLERVETDIQDLLAEWSAVDDIEPGTLSHEQVAARLASFSTAAEEATETREALDETAAYEDRIVDKIQTGSTRAAFDEIKESDDGWFEVFVDLASEYEDLAAVEAALEEVHSALEEVTEELESARDRRVSLRGRLDDLKSDDDIVAAREQISEGREELRVLGEEYAVNRIAEHLTQELHRRFIREVAGPLIEDASDIFRKITAEYDGISHNEQFDNLDFQALREGNPPHGSDELSRATAEQLFLAVRLARIRQLDVSLPVVIDDSLTNFDPSHGARTFQTIAELAGTNQVFFLTCHPEHVALAEQYGDADQFWCLTDGQFDGPHDSSEALYELLQTESGRRLEPW